MLKACLTVLLMLLGTGGMVPVFSAAAQEIAAPKPVNPLSPAEEEFLQGAMSAFEKNDLVTVESRLGQFRLLAGKRPLPNEIRVVVADLAFRTSITKLKEAFWKSRPAPLDEEIYLKTWGDIEHRTQELLAIHLPTAADHLKRGSKTSALMSVARAQRLYMDRSSALLTLERFALAVSELDSAEKLFREYESIATEEIHVETRTPDGIRRLPTKRGAGVGFYEREILLLERILTMQLWHLKESQNRTVIPDPLLTQSLVEVLQAFVNEFPGHVRSYAFICDIMTLRGGAIDSEKIRKILDATENKNSPEYAGNMLSFGNQLQFFAGQVDAALKVYLDVIKGGRCPANRLAELHIVVGDILTAKGQHDEAKEYYLKAKGFDFENRFSAIYDMKISSGETQKAMMAPTVVASHPVAERPSWMPYFLIANIALPIVGIVAWRMNRRKSP